MNYYLPRYDLPLVLDRSGPGLHFYTPGSDKNGDLMPTFSKQEDLLTKSNGLDDSSSRYEGDLINTFFSDKVAMLKAALESIVSRIDGHLELTP